MALVAYDPCNDALGNHTPASECAEEGSGILGMFLVKSDFDVSSVSTAQHITDAITAGDLVKVRDIEAYFPVPTQVTIPGIAGRVERHGHFTYEMGFKHEGVEANLKFWNKINNTRNYGVILVTEEYKAFAPLDRDLEPVICSITAWPAGEQEFGKNRFMQGTVKWKSKDLLQYCDNFDDLLQAHFQI
jgi:hypothetical protein